ncbi:MAG TPA: tetratricopeptide repeat protein [Thermoanaerobaculia bacterium]
MLAPAALLLTALLAPDPAPTPTALERGELYLQHKQFARAETALAAAVAADPASARAHGDLALALLQQHKTPEAVAEARLAAAFGPESAEARYIYGLALSSGGKWAEATRQYEKAVALKPTETGPLAALAACYAAAEDPRAGATYAKLIALRPGVARYRADYVEYLWRIQKVEEADAAMTAALAAIPTDRDLPLRYGRALAQQERFAEAAIALESARKLGASDAATFALLAGVEERAGRAEAARATLTTAVEAHPEDVSLEHDLGRLWLAEGRTDEAFARLERAALAQPGNGAYQLDYGRALEASGKLQAAEQAYRRAVALSPNLPRAHYALGRLLQRTGKKEEAQRELAIHHALYEKGRDTVAAADVRDSATSLAWADLNRGNATEALIRFAALPPSAEALRGQALALQHLGRHADAVRVLERARSLAPDDPRIELLLTTELSRQESP